MKCIKCSSTYKIERHHVVYESKKLPEIITPLCKKCHSIITRINTRYAQLWGKLSMNQRIELFEFFKHSEMKILLALLNSKKSRSKARKKRNQSYKALQEHRTLNEEFSRIVGYTERKALEGAERQPDIK